MFFVFCMVFYVYGFSRISLQDYCWLVIRELFLTVTVRLLRCGGANDAKADVIKEALEVSFFFVILLIVFVVWFSIILLNCEKMICLM